MTKDSFWGIHQLSGDKVSCFHQGPLHLWCKTSADELWIAYCHKQISELDDGKLPSVEDVDDSSWLRWSLETRSKRLNFKPLLPDMPVVVKPEHVFRLAPAVQTRIYVRVPLWVRIEIGEVEITQLPTVVLSRTWFGDFHDGELCYWISSSARKRIAPDPNRSFLAISPISIINQSAEELLVEKICHRVGELALFNEGKQLWTNLSKVFYKGQSNISEIRTAPGPPKEASRAKRVADPRVNSGPGFTAKTFATIKDISGLGIFNR